MYSFVFEEWLHHAATLQVNIPCMMQGKCTLQESQQESLQESRQESQHAGGFMKGCEQPCTELYQHYGLRW